MERLSDGDGAVADGGVAHADHRDHDGRSSKALAHSPLKHVADSAAASTDRQYSAERAIVTRKTRFERGLAWAF